MALTKQQKKHQELLHALLENYTTVVVEFLTGQVSSKHYTYKVPTSWGVKMYDQLVVDTPSGVGVVHVLEVHAVPQLDSDADFQYKWAVQKVDPTEYKALQAREQAFLEKMVVVEREHARRDVLAKVQTALSGAAAQTFDDAVIALNGKGEQAAGQTSPEATTAS